MLRGSFSVASGDGSGASGGLSASVRAAAFPGLSGRFVVRLVTGGRWLMLCPVWSGGGLRGQVGGVVGVVGVVGVRFGGSPRCQGLSGAVRWSVVVSVRWLRCGWRLFWWSLSVLFCV